MVSPRCPQNGPPVSESTTMRFSKNSVSARLKSRACMRAASLRSPHSQLRQQRNQARVQRQHRNQLQPRRPHKRCNMSDIVTERSDSVLRVQLNRPASKNAMTSAMYIALAEVFNTAAQGDQIRVVLWHGAGDSFCAGNDVGDFLKNPPGKGESPQALLMKGLINFDKPIVAAVH